MDFRNIPPAVKAILLLNAIVFVLTQFLFPPLKTFLAAYYPMSQDFKIWQIITHMFVHGDFMHILFNMLTLFSFGPVLERIMGQKKFITFYFICGLGSFVLFNVWNFFQIQQIVQAVEAIGMNPSEVFANAHYTERDARYYYGLPAPAQDLYRFLITPMVGASGAIFGVVTAFAILFPNAKLFFMFIPFPIKAKYLLPMIILGSLYLGIRQLEGDNIAHFAHLGGAVVGYFWIKNWKKKQNMIL